MVWSLIKTPHIKLESLNLFTLKYYKKLNNIYLYPYIHIIPLPKIKSISWVDKKDNFKLKDRVGPVNIQYDWAQSTIEFSTNSRYLFLLLLVAELYSLNQNHASFQSKNITKLELTKLNKFSYQIKPEFFTIKKNTEIPSHFSNFRGIEVLCTEQDVNRSSRRGSIKIKNLFSFLNKPFSEIFKYFNTS